MPRRCNNLAGTLQYSHKDVHERNPWHVIQPYISRLQVLHCHGLMSSCGCPKAYNALIHAVYTWLCYVMVQFNTTGLYPSWPGSPHWHWGNDIMTSLSPCQWKNPRELESMHHINSLWLSDAIWRQRSESTLAPVMAWCLTAPSHYLNQCWLIITKVEWHSSMDIFTRDNSAINHWNHLENQVPRISFKFTRANELKHTD